MTSAPKLSRRHALAGAAALPFAAAATTLTSGPAMAQAPMQPGVAAQSFRFKVGGFEVTTLLAGTRTVDAPQNIFGMNASAQDFAAVSAAANLPIDRAQFFFTPTLVNTGKELILFDTGLSGGSITAAVAAAGYNPDQVSHVVLTHMHGDHIGGLMTDGAPTFANATYVTGQVEYDHWAQAGNDRFNGMVAPLAEKMRFIGDNTDVTSGVTSVASFGHTPGHMGYMLESNGQQFMLIADLANHYVWSLAHPDWEVRFDMDKTAAAQSRRKVLDMLAADKVPFVGYHMPFPGVGYVDTKDSGYHYVPHTYQLLMG